MGIVNVSRTRIETEEIKVVAEDLAVGTILVRSGVPNPTATFDIQLVGEGCLDEGQIFAMVEFLRQGAKLLKEARDGALPAQAAVAEPAEEPAEIQAPPVNGEPMSKKEFVKRAITQNPSVTYEEVNERWTRSGRDDTIGYSTFTNARTEYSKKAAKSKPMFRVDRR